MPWGQEWCPSPFALRREGCRYPWGLQAPKIDRWRGGCWGDWWGEGAGRKELGSGEGAVIQGPVRPTVLAVGSPLARPLEEAEELGWRVRAS